MERSLIGQLLLQLDQALQPVERVPLLFDGTFENAFPAGTMRLPISDFRQPGHDYRDLRRNNEKAD
ncbi:hypothetical protein FNU76_01820 [Chitinimonas arctica]|uniref:Uncharacterized protein n=1 Tax=Chitinimonas arctica TaxID=2594795 RepID=A0A516SAL1_9NEIS|nr:hypothetical protein [Chitinimonas arctica]QDQ25191.1 hypothetical protein FNU76_01820 [Chitinimonas arctica]